MFTLHNLTLLSLTLLTTSTTPLPPCPPEYTPTVTEYVTVQGLGPPPPVLPAAMPSQYAGAIGEVFPARPTRPKGDVILPGPMLSQYANVMGEVFLPAPMGAGTSGKGVGFEVQMSTPAPTTIRLAIVVPTVVYQITYPPALVAPTAPG
jgi:hypothetical protein